MSQRVYNIRDRRRPPDCAYIGRAGHGMTGTWGNHHNWQVIGRGEACRRYEADVKNNPEFRAKMRTELTGTNLVCFCAPTDGVGIGPDDPLQCHGQVILRAIRGDYDG